MSIWPVFIEDWQQQSGGRPFAVGDEVEWSIVLIDGQQHGWPDELLVDARVQLHEHPDQRSIRGSVAVSGGMQAWWEGSEAPGTLLQLRAALLEDHHSLALAYSRGTVRRIQVVTQHYEPRPDGVLIPIWEGWQARDVERSPAYFASDDERVPSSFSNGWYAVRPKSGETGLLVALEPDMPAGPQVLQVRSLQRPIY